MADPDDGNSTSLALGMAMMMLAAVGAGTVMGLLLLGFHGGLYVPILMPAMAGWGVGTGVAFVRRRFGVRQRWPAVLAAILGAVIAYGGYQVLVYLHVLHFLATKLHGVLDRATGAPYAAVQRFIESQTGHHGYLAFIAFVSKGHAAALSPLGVVGRLEPGLVLTLIAIGLGALVATTAAIAIALIRSADVGYAAPRAASCPRVRELIARTDDETLADVMHSIDCGAVEEAGRILRRPVADETFALAVVHNPYSAESYTLEVHELTDDGLGRLRTSRELTSWDGQALIDELRVGR